MSKVVGGGVLLAVVAFLAYFASSFLFSGQTISFSDLSEASGFSSSTEQALIPARPAPPVVAHLPTPEAVKAVYMTACIASTPNLREKMLNTLTDTQINSLMIDIKDYTGTLAYASTSVPSPMGKGCRIKNLPEILTDVHKRGLYAIARVTVFQDPLYSSAYPSLAVQSRSHSGPWTDRKGLAFIDPNSEAYWDYIVDISKEAHSIGFDEINFDYIRFPSDGNMSDAVFATPASTTKAQVIKGFFAYLQSKMQPEGIVTSADIFGQTTVNVDDLGIGQILENTLPYFDYVSPMVYPSHFIKGFNNFANPAEHPYEVIKFTMTRASERASLVASSSLKLRPWLQAFDLGADYTPAMVHAQMQAVYDSGLTSWMLWDAANKYTKAEL